MVKLVFCVRRRADMDPDEFYRYWKEQHGPLVASYAKALGATRYVQSHTNPVFNDVLAQSRGSGPAFDGLAEVWFESIEAMATTMASPEGIEAGRALLEDEQRFIDLAGSSLFMTEEHVVVG